MADLYDPLTYDNLMAGVIRHFETLTLELLDPVSDIEGPGIYALFYAGDFPAYQAIADTTLPIYVGKAVPPGSRRGDDVNVQSPALKARLREHANSIRRTQNLAACVVGTAR